jgi:hypothetical protein
VKLLLITGVGLLIAVALLFAYFSQAYFFAVNAKAIDSFAKDQKAAEQSSKNVTVAIVKEKKSAAGAP